LLLKNNNLYEYLYMHNAVAACRAFSVVCPMEWNSLPDSPGPCSEYRQLQIASEDSSLHSIK